MLVVAAILSASPAAAQAPNIVRLTMATPHFAFNRLLVSVTVCAPRSQRCATVDKVMVDTGSTGLRLEQAAVPASLQLPPMAGPDGGALGECVRFMHDNAWGPMFRADLHIGGMVAADLPVQILGAGTDTAPASCPSSGRPSTSNGTLGLSQYPTDCQGACRQSATLPGYFTCRAGACAPIPGHVDEAYRMTNPVARFARHDNGFVIDLPGVPDGGAEAVEGTLTFGVGTGDTNTLGDARILRLNASGRFWTVYDGRSYPDSYIDSGTETFVLPDDRLNRCPRLPWAFCVTPERTLTATMIGRDGTAIGTSFQVGQYPDAAPRHPPRHPGASGGAAMVAPRDGDVFVWGAPFFLGRRTYVVLDGRTVPGAPGVTGPLYAFRPHE